MQNLTLTRFEIDSFLRIDSSEPIVLDLGAAYGSGKNIALLEGDMKVGKTSTITALRFALADNLEIEQKDLVNLKDHRLSLSLEFKVDGNTYKVRATKSRFVLEKFLPSEPAWLDVKEPKTTLQRLVGTLGTSPMYLKEKRGKDQIREFRKSFGVGNVVDEQEAKLLAGIQEVSEARREANKNYSRIKSALESDELYQRYEDSRLEFSQAKPIEAYRNSMNAAAANKTKYENAQSRLGQLQDQEKQQMQRISELEAQLALAKNDVQKTREAIATGNQWLVENRSMLDDFQVAMQEYEEANRFVLQQERWRSVLQQEGEMHEFETMVQGFDSQKEALRIELLKLTESYKPDIPGLEIKVSSELTDTQEGIYYNGLSLAQLSESELWDLYMQIWNLKNVQLVFIENLSSLGSYAVETLNHLAASGVKIFASQVRRGQEKISISFTDKIV